MIELRIRRPQISVPFFSNPQTEVDIIKSDGKVRFIKSFYSGENCPTDYQAGSGHSREVLMQSRTSHLSKRSFALVSVGMVGNTKYAKNCCLTPGEKMAA